MTKRLFVLSALLLVMSSAVAQDNDGGIYFFSFKQLRYSIGHQLQLATFTHHTRSPQLATYYISPGEELLPTPVYNRAYSFVTLGYQPKFRLIEFGSKAAFTLKTPISLAFSTVDLRTFEGDRYSHSGVSEFDYNSGTYTYNRPSAIGYISGEAGALVGFDLWAQSTVENTNTWGLAFAGGINAILSPIFMDGFTDQERADYKGQFAWAMAVGQVELNWQKTSLIYMFGVRPIRVHYSDRLLNDTSVMTNTYHRVSIGFKLGT